MAWQSAGRTPEPWLGPDILDARRPRRIRCPRRGDVRLRFVADHLEVLYDLDLEASKRASDLGIAFDRTACVNDDAAVIGALADRVVAVTSNDTATSATTTNDAATSDATTDSGSA
ncbi:MAG: ferrochelatase [Ilumatobacteraceae bacterium]